MTQQTEQQSKHIVRLTEAASLEVKQLLANDPREGIGLRLGVKGGGCSGLSYLVDFDHPTEQDHIQEESGFKVFIDPKSSLYLKDSFIDFQGGISGKGFQFENPNAQNSCGCGSSFAI